HAKPHLASWRGARGADAGPRLPTTTACPQAESPCGHGSQLSGTPTASDVDGGTLHAGGFKSLGTVFAFEVHLFPILQRLESIPFDHAVVDENVLAVFMEDETKPLLVIKPLDLAHGHLAPTFPCFRRRRCQPSGVAALPIFHETCLAPHVYLFH